MNGIMVQFARLVRWWFGMQALIVAVFFVIITASFAWSLTRVALHIPRSAAVHRAVVAQDGVDEDDAVEAVQRPHAPPRKPFTLPYGLPMTRTAILGIAAVVVASFLTSAVAWWALRRGWPSARFWAMSASALSLWDFGVGTFFGVAGLIVFWRKDVVAAMAKAGAPERVAGDGTSKFVDVGAQVVAGVAYLMASYSWAKWAAHMGLVRHEGTRDWMEFLGALYVAVLLHELGHFLAGLSMDMTLRAFAVGPIAGEYRGGRWRITMNPMGFVGGGQVAMIPLHLRQLRGRFAYLALAGPVFSLMAGMIALSFALTAPGSRWEGVWRFLALTGTMCMIDFVVNLIPLRPEGAYSDGARILQMVKGGRWAEEYMAYSMVASSLVTDLRPSQFDLPLLWRVAEFHNTGEKGSQVRLFMALHYIETGRTQEAIEVWREAARLHPEASADGSAEYTFMEAAVACDVEKAQAWWRRVEAKGDSKREVDYWRGRAALLMAEGNLEEARRALETADGHTRSLPIVGAYEYDRWCLDMIRRRLAEPKVSRVQTAELAQV